MSTITTGNVYFNFMLPSATPREIREKYKPPIQEVIQKLDQTNLRYNWENLYITLPPGKDYLPLADLDAFLTARITQINTASPPPAVPGYNAPYALGSPIQEDHYEYVDNARNCYHAYELEDSGGNPLAVTVPGIPAPVTLYIGLSYRTNTVW